jgi:hypothetical protein
MLKNPNAEVGAAVNIEARLVPGKAKHGKRGMKPVIPPIPHRASQFSNPALVDTSSLELVCIPTDVTSIAPVTP